MISRGVADKITDQMRQNRSPKPTQLLGSRTSSPIDPAPLWHESQCRFWSLNRSLDVQALAKENLASACQALKNNPKATVVALPDMNHLLQDAKTGPPNEYNDIKETMSPHLSQNNY
jgi:hypothetical protein